MAYNVHSKIGNLDFKGLLMHACGKKLHASNADYRVQNAVYNRFLEGDLIADKLLRTDNKQQEQLLGYICTAANNRKNNKLLETAEVNKINSYIGDNLSFMTMDFLDRLEQIATASGLLSLACCIHNQNNQLSIICLNRKNNLSKTNSARLFWAYLHNNDLSNAEDTLKNLCCNSYTPEDIAFSDLIGGKNLAIIGPSSSGTDYTDEILSEFDVVIVMNYSAIVTPIIKQRDKYKLISYYNGKVSDKILTADTDLPYLRDLDFAVIKIKKGKEDASIPEYTNFRQPLRYNCLFLRGAANLLQVILQDLMHFNPLRIKIFYLNIGLTEVLHDKEYLKALGRAALEPRDQWRSLAKHNHIFQYDYVRYLYLAGKIEADDRLTEILELGNVEFMRQMEELENKKERSYISHNQ